MKRDLYLPITTMLRLKASVLSVTPRELEELEARLRMRKRLKNKGLDDMLTPDTVDTEAGDGFQNNWFERPLNLHHPRMLGSGATTVTTKAANEARSVPFSTVHESRRSRKVLPCEFFLQWRLRQAHGLTRFSMQGDQIMQEMEPGCSIHQAATLYRISTYRHLSQRHQGYHWCVTYSLQDDES